MESKLFSPVTFGPLTLRNRTIRSAAFESMCPENTPTQMLLDYHRSVAAGGVGMTTVAYAAVTQSGLSFDRQLWLRPSIIPRLHELTKAVHDEGAAVYKSGIVEICPIKIYVVSLLYPHLQASTSILLRLCVEWKKRSFRKWRKRMEMQSIWRGKPGLTPLKYMRGTAI